MFGKFKEVFVVDPVPSQLRHVHAIDSLKGRIQQDQLLQHKLDLVRVRKVESRLEFPIMLQKILGVSPQRIGIGGGQIYDRAAMPAEEQNLAFLRSAVIR